MKFSPLFLATFLLSWVCGWSQPLQAQEPQKWKTFQQTFSIVRAPQIYCKYGHVVALDNGKFVMTATRDFSGEEFFTSVLHFDLADVDAPKMTIVKGKEGYAPDLWYLYIPVKNPNHAPPRTLATPQTDRRHLIVKDEVRVDRGGKPFSDTWILTQMYINFDNEAAASQAKLEIAAASY